MSADVILLPVIRLERRRLDFIEQRDREWSARFAEMTTVPDRTRPLLVVRNKTVGPKPKFVHLVSISLAAYPCRKDKADLTP